MHEGYFARLFSEKKCEYEIALFFNKFFCNMHFPSCSFKNFENGNSLDYIFEGNSFEN
jgi:hypothetical protein